MKRICVFCGSRIGRNLEYRAATAALGKSLARQGIELVYGGGNVGLMGVIADACLAAGGRVTGIIPEALVGREVAGRRVEHPNLNQLEIVDSMHTRKARMAELADGFIALPGGYGTLEELFEVLTWAQLGFHQKPVGLLNVAGYWDPLLALCDQAVSEEFLSPQSRSLLMARSDPEALLAAFATFHAEPATTWIRTPDQL